MECDQEDTSLLAVTVAPVVDQESLAVNVKSEGSINETAESGTANCMFREAKIEYNTTFRVLRKRINNKVMSVGSKKRKCNFAPRKFTSTAQKKGEDLYTNYRYRMRKMNKLETIYEEPKSCKDGTVAYAGGAKERYLNFNFTTKAKEKKRVAKISKLIGKKKMKRQKMTMESFLSKLSNLMESDENERLLSSLVKCSLN